MSTERQRVTMLAEIFATEAQAASDVVLGIGDDAALLCGQNETLVWSIDAQVEDVHFKRAWMSFVDVGYRATMAALSDLAAMGSRPLGVLSALTLPADLGDDDLCAIAEGQREAAALLGTRVIGGNMTRGETLSITTTVLGVSARPVLRGGATAGDRVWLAGKLGHAACGLLLSMRGTAPRSDAQHAVVSAFRRPIALITAGRTASEKGASAMIDVSDGLAVDLAQLAGDSQVAIVIDPHSLEDTVVDDVCGELGLAPRDPILHGGEDYALVATLQPGASLAGFRPIGVVRGDLPKGVWLDNGGSPTRVEERGFDHFDGTK